MNKDELQKSSHLTEEIKQQFLDILMESRYNRPKNAFFKHSAKEFIAELDSYIPVAKRRLSSQPVNITPGRKKQKDGLKALNRAIKYFEEALIIMYPGTPTEDATMYLSNSPPIADLYKTRDKLAESIKAKPRGRPPSIKTNIPEIPGNIKNLELPDRMQEVIQEIVYLFWIHLGKPSLYKDGPLFTIVGKSLQLLNHPQEHLYNRIKTAIDTLVAHNPHLLGHK